MAWYVMRCYPSKNSESQFLLQNGTTHFNCHSQCSMYKYRTTNNHGKHIPVVEIRNNTSPLCHFSNILVLLLEDQELNLFNFIY